MFDKNLLPELKGAPLSIIFLLAMTGNRTISVSDLSAQTGFDRKTTRKGLDLLIEHQIVTCPRTNRYQLVGKNVQLPLYWDEKIEPLPEAETEWGKIPQNCGEFPQLETRIEELERRVSDLEEWGKIPKLGNIPQNWGKIPQNEMAIELLSGNDNGENFPTCGKIPQNCGEIPHEVNLINIENTDPKEVSKYVDIDTYLLNENSNNTKLPDVENFPNEEKIPELFLSAWNAAMQQMEASMGKGTFMDILHGAVPIGYEDGHYTILMDNTFKRDWAEVRLTDMIEKILMMMLDRKVTVSFVIDNVSDQDGDAARVQDRSAGEAAAAVQSPCAQYEAPSLELLPGSGELIGICNDYLLDPTGIDYSKEQLQELISLEPDPEVLQFILPIATKFDNAKTWCGKDLQAAKRSLLRKNGIVNGMAAEIVHNDAATLEMIYEVCSELCPENKDAVGSRIRALTAEGKIPEF